ncbi:hypothetical protein [Methylobacter sp. BlB1]|jgi:hypothetical protein|uniref:hypothetical protein n=1 Tax=Methylobacter sp. BlB1 TaxID=2785914 RepID=UPI0018960E14|nr:hypothetical protein [Methylobacter sp. BlB1]MBF6650664.1 hypothetical protein [Methylobacter sp. BlB1]
MVKSHFNIFAILITVFLVSGCGTFKPYAQNPFNPDARIKPISTAESAGGGGRSLAYRATDLGLTAASRPVPGTIPHGAEVGIAAAALLLGGPSGSGIVPDNDNYLLIGMPLTYATDEADAQLKMGALMEKAIIQSLSPEYQTKIEEYDDHHSFSKVLRPRWIRVNGPLCENWSCQVTAPIPTQSAGQWEGEIVKTTNNGREIYWYQNIFREKIGFVKITKEFDKSAIIAGSRHFVEGQELSYFDYAGFYQRVSANLPEWVSLVITRKGDKPYALSQGNQIELHVK